MAALPASGFVIAGQIQTDPLPGIGAARRSARSRGILPTPIQVAGWFNAESETPVQVGGVSHVEPSRIDAVRQRATAQGLSR